MIGPKIRILSGSPAVIEHQVNELLEDYAPMSWSFTMVKDAIVVTVLLISQAEIRKQQLAAAPLPMAGRRS